MAAGVVPQSSCSLSPHAPATTCSRSAAGALSLPLPVMPTLSGSESHACSICRMYVAPGVHVVADVPALDTPPSVSCLSFCVYLLSSALPPSPNNSAGRGAI